MSVSFNLGQRAIPNPLINIGGLLDVPTAALVTGAKGETIYNGGSGQVTAIVGRGNTYKSTIMHYMVLSAASKLLSATETAITTYDTETNVRLDSLQSLANSFENLPEDMFSGNDPMWTVTNKNLIPGNKWDAEINKYADEKSKDKKNLIKLEPLANT